MTTFDKRTNSVFADDKTRFSFNANTGRIQVHVRDSELNEITLSLEKGGKEEAKILKVLSAKGLAPDYTVDRNIDLPLKAYELNYANDIEHYYQTNRLDPEYDVCFGISTKDNPVFYASKPTYMRGVEEEHEVIKEDRHLMIYGVPGTGKTTLAGNILRGMLLNENGHSPRDFVLYNPKMAEGNGDGEYKFFGSKKRPIRGRFVVTDELELLVTLRNILTNFEYELAFDMVFVMEDFSDIIEFKVTDSMSAESIRTAKSVRAEILSLIQEISRASKLDPTRVVTFIFTASSINRSDYNAFIRMCGTRVCVGKPEDAASYVLFGRNVAHFSEWPLGRGYVEKSHTYEWDNEFASRKGKNKGTLFQTFAGIINPETK